MENIYLALDFPNGQVAKEFIHTNDLQGIPLKIGMELFYHEGPAIVEYFKRQDHPIFLDLKLHDIPNTVGQAMKNLAQLEVDIVNVHATGGLDMIAAAREGLEKETHDYNRPLLIAVTILTSFSNKQFQEQLKTVDPLEDYVLHLAKMAKAGGADGVVCSVHEANGIKEVCGEDFITITPGIRLRDSHADDQQRIATPNFAKANGSHIIVVGRTITKAKDPKLAYETVVEEWLKGE